MVSKIICPTDFSTAANNATLYAAKLAQVMNAELFLVHVEHMKPLMGGASMAGVADDAEKEMLDEKLKQLKNTAAEVEKSFNIKCTFELEVTSESLAKAIARLGVGNSMVVMGTNGADNLYQFYFGSHTYRVISEANCPVLLVPEKSMYASFHNVLYALTYEEKGRLAIDSLIEFTRPYPKATFNFLHVSGNDTPISQDVYNAMKEEVETTCGGKITPHFSRTFADNAGEGIEAYIATNPTDLLVMAAHHRTILETIFMPKPVLDGLSAVPSVPILIFHV